VEYSWRKLNVHFVQDKKLLLQKLQQNITTTINWFGLVKYDEG